MQITITNLEKADYMTGLCMKTMYYGPHESYEPGREMYNNDNIEDLAYIYSVVTIPEGWYLSDIVNTYLDTTEIVIKSGYMWPSDFLLIILNKTNNTYFISEETKTYAFHSYFECDMQNYVEGSVILNKQITLEENYKYGKEIGEFFLRLAVTLGIELLLALAFKFTKKSFLIIAITNVVTQIGLNVSLNLIAHFSGKNPIFAIIYMFIEVAIMAIEATIFAIFCKRKNSEAKLPVILYAIAANILSFGLGMLLWLLL